jgi:exosortase A
MNTPRAIGIADAADRVPGPVPAPARWHTSLVTLVLGLAAWASLFTEEIVAAVSVWTSSTAYNHCWLILPIAAWLAWQRRGRLAVLAPEPAPLFALLALPGAIAWLAAERLGVMEGRQLVAMGLLWVLVLAVLGWRVSLAFAGPLAYLVFLVPFGGFAVAPLQHITARLIDWGLDLVGITHFVDGLMIETPAGLFHVAEACAGLRFIIAALAFGALYALVIFRSPWRRLVVMVLALVVPILANGVRAWGIIVLAEYLGSAEAAAADHIVYGWGFFSVIILLLILAGLPFREDGTPPAASRFPSRPGTAARPAPLAAALLLTVGLSAVGPGTAAALAWRSGPPEERPVRLIAPEGCTQAADGLGLACEGLAISARMLVFSPTSNWRAVSEARWRLGSLGTDTAVDFSVPIPGGGVWRSRQDGGRAAATAAWLDGRVVGDGLESRMAQARNSLFGGGGRPVFVVMTAGGGDASLSPQRARALVQAVLAAQRTLVAEAAERSRAN